MSSQAAGASKNWSQFLVESEEKLPKRAGRWFRILALDGGPNSSYYLHYLNKIVEKHPSFLAQVDLFAGTSSGTFAALFLASQEKERLRHEGRDVMRELIAQNQNFLESYNTLGDSRFIMGRLGHLTWNHLLRVFPGGKALFTADQAYDKLERIFSNRCLDDIPGKALVVSYALYPSEEEDKETGEVAPHGMDWGPRINHNLLPPDYGENNHRSLADLVLYSSSMPMFLPSHHGHVDGAVFANNPAMAAVSTVANVRHVYDLFLDGEEQQAIIRDLSDILVFSLGAADLNFVDPESAKRDHKAVREAAVNKGALDWGVPSWIMRLQDPIRLIKLMFNADEHGVSTQCKNLLHSSNFCRLSVPPYFCSTINMVDLLMGSTGEANRIAKCEADEWVLKGDLDNWVQKSPNVIGRAISHILGSNLKFAHRTSNITSRKVAVRSEELRSGSHEPSAFDSNDPFSCFLSEWLFELEIFAKEPTIPDDVVWANDWNEKLEQPLLYPRSTIENVYLSPEVQAIWADSSDISISLFLRRFEFVFIPLVALSDIVVRIITQNWIQDEELDVLVQGFYEVFDTGDAHHNKQMFHAMLRDFEFLQNNSQPGEPLHPSRRSYIRIRMWLEFVWNLEHPNSLSSHRLWEMLTLNTTPSQRGEARSNFSINHLFHTLIDKLIALTVSFEKTHSVASKGSETSQVNLKSYAVDSCERDV